MKQNAVVVCQQCSEKHYFLRYEKHGTRSDHLVLPFMIKLKTGFT